MKGDEHERRPEEELDPIESLKKTEGRRKEGQVRSIDNTVRQRRERCEISPALYLSPPIPNKPPSRNPNHYLAPAIPGIFLHTASQIAHVERPLSKYDISSEAIAVKL